MTDWDVVIAGGGPAGSVCAIELARRGHRVLLLEAQSSPRYRIGESLSPSACAALESYGIDFAEAGFVGKPGATFVWGEHAPFTTYYAGDTAWQVRRADLDARMLGRAENAGAAVRPGSRLERVLFAGERAIGVGYLGADGVRQEARAAWIIDATGRDAVLARQLGDLYADPTLEHHAAWAYWSGGGRLPDRAMGNSLFVGGTPTWWYIPVDDRDDLFSVGLIGSGPLPETDPDTAYATALGSVPMLRELLKDASRSGPVRVSSAGAQIGERLTGDGWLLVGDAAGFVDPILTPGVQLAVHFGQLAARTVDAALRTPGRADALTREYERRFRRQYEVFRILAGNLYAAGTRKPKLISPDAIASGDEQADRLTFMSVISGMPSDRLRAELGAYLGTRAAAVPWGGSAPAFGEAEGFAFLSYVVRRYEPSVADLTPEAVLRLAPGVACDVATLLPSSDDDVPGVVRVLHSATGDRFLLSRELETLVGVLEEEPSFLDAARRFAAEFGCDSNPGEFGEWMRLLARHALLEWRQATGPAAAESRV